MQHNQYVQVSESQIVDPIVQLMKNVRLRRTKVTIPNGEEMYPSVYNDRKMPKRVLTKVTIGEDPSIFEKPIRLPRILQNLRSPDFPTLKQKLILEQLKKVPVYVVANGTKEIVMAAPRSNQCETLFQWLYTKYYNLCVWEEDDGPVSIVLFFINKEDATLYLQDIAKNDRKAAEKTNLSVQLTNLDVFYKLNRTSSPGTQAKIIADLEEIYKLVSDYIPKQVHPFNPKQSCSKTLYQGTPIYVINPMVEKRWGKKSVVEYTQTICYKDQDPIVCTKNVFFRLEDAYLAWDKFCDDNEQKRLPLVPNIEVYNLESYLLDLEHQDLPVEAVINNNFIANHSSTLDLEQKRTQEIIKSRAPLAKKVTWFISENWKKLTTLSKGMLWIFTSDTLPTEDNSW
jgi:hypothetical protein